MPLPSGRPSSSENPTMPTPDDVNVSFNTQGVAALPSEATLTPLSARGPPDETTIGPARAVEEAIDQTNPAAKTLLRSIATSQSKRRVARTVSSASCAISMPILPRSRSKEPASVSTRSHIRLRARPDSLARRRAWGESSSPRRLLSPWPDAKETSIIVGFGRLPRHTTPPIRPSAPLMPLVSHPTYRTGT
jgi:hypothetical protein